ncbi:Slit-like protein 2 protein, partial [Armadillidium nasatum]
ILKESWKQSEFPNLNGTHSLELIRIDRASLKELPQDLCSKTPKLRSLVLHRNKITKVPKLEACKDLRLLDLSNNEIKEIEDLRFERQNELQDLLLQNNLLSEIRPNTFVGLRSLQVL